MKKVMEVLKKVGSWVSKGFKALFGNIPAALCWIFVGLITYFTLGKLPFYTIIALYAAILGLVLSVKVYGK